MSEQIDWSKAPEGCIGAFTSKHDFRSVGFSSFFVITKRYSDYGAKAGCSGEDQDGKEYHVFEKYWDYHEKPASWSGEGLPPVGVVCEVFNRELSNPEWEKCTILFAGKHRFLYDSESCAERCGYIENLEFRPVRTPEQFAADEREAAIKEMTAGYSKDSGTLAGWAAYVYDALGYRKEQK